MSKVVALETEGAVMDDVAMETGSVTTVDSAVNGKNICVCIYL